MIQPFLAISARSRRLSNMVVFIVAFLLTTVGAALAINMDQGGAPKTPAPTPENPHAGFAMPNPAATATTIPSAASISSGPFLRPDFESAVDFTRLRLLAIDHMDQVKILDSWARTTLSTIAHHSSLEGQDPLYTTLDIAFRPEVWADRNIIYVQAIPIREQLVNLVPDKVEGDRILHTGLVSPEFLNDNKVIDLLNRISLDTRLAPSVGKVFSSLDAFERVAETFHVCPPDAGHRDTPWYHPVRLLSNLPKDAQEQLKLQPLPPVEGYTAEQAWRINLAFEQLMLGWREGDSKLVNLASANLCDILPTIDSAGYPSQAKRVTEVWYNRTYFGTVANVFLYFIAMTLFLMVAVGAAKKVERPALIVFTIAVGVHFASMAIRYWLAGRWPTQNQFESVLGSALLGCIAGWLLEMWKRNGLFGMAFSFVGFLAMTGCMTAPYWSGRDIGGTIGKTPGILTTTYWLYIHVNIVISSYGLIGASFALGLLYLLARLWFWINPLEPGYETGGDGTVSLPPSPAPSNTAVAIAEIPALREVQSKRTALLDTLDQANMVVLQLAFWFLGIGIICGAIWADQSWGRPWGWDPKETFALVTWIVYLIIVHARFVTRAKGDVTAWMAVAGFGVMMFNWIGVNFWLAGLHSYA
ncbi:MAG TPA: cytochrome c biogenesis protein CcsA [Phycisphaerae bacterium]|nr:cytochrome c biogenesis protein CcsA [Phycisphaerae bacterium]